MTESEEELTNTSTQTDDSQTDGSQTDGSDTSAQDSPILLTPFVLPEAGCPMSHCDAQMSDRSVGLVPDSGEVVWHDTSASGSDFGVGCSTNGIVAACTYRETTGIDALVVYNHLGERLWTSKDHLSEDAWTSAPLISNDGEVIAVDETNLLRFDSKGDVLWSTQTEGGRPISPILTENGTVVLASQGGPVSSYNPQTGEMLDSLDVTLEDAPDERFDTINTPASAGDRVYVSMQRASDEMGLLAALELDQENGELSVVWTYSFGGPSGASPLLVDGVVYFDGDRLAASDTVSAPHAFAIRDAGDRPEVVWTQPLSGMIQASFAQDPRGGFWLFSLGNSLLERRGFENGEIIESLNLDEVIPGASDRRPSSVMSISGTDEQPVMLLGTLTLIPQLNTAVAIDLQERSLRWEVELDSLTASQFVVLEPTSEESVVVFPTRKSGAYGVSRTR